MYGAETEDLRERRGRNFRLLDGDGPLRYAQVLDLWQQDEAFRSFFIELLADDPAPAFRWETPPVTAGTLDRPFEFVLLESPGLQRGVDERAFADHFEAAGAESVVAFENLGHDAVLVVPCPLGPPEVYGHLAAFLRGAPERQRHALWQVTAGAMRERLGTRPVWLSTAGMGVAWLHVRLDSRPKYYGHGPYREA